MVDAYKAYTCSRCELSKYRREIYCEIKNDSQEHEANAGQSHAVMTALNPTVIFMVSMRRSIELILDFSQAKYQEKDLIAQTLEFFQ